MKTHYLVYKDKNGFTKEVEQELLHPQERVILRQYENINRSVYFTVGGLTAVDREFRLKNQFYAMGKQICYYEEC